MAKLRLDPVDSKAHCAVSQTSVSGPQPYLQPHSHGCLWTTPSPKALCPWSPRMEKQKPEGGTLGVG